jgi:hypothetical protein
VHSENNTTTRYKVSITYEFLLLSASAPLTDGICLACTTGKLSLET